MKSPCGIPLVFRQRPIVTLIVILCLSGYLTNSVLADESPITGQENETITSSPPITEGQSTGSTEKLTVNPEKDWGSYYDPQNVFCGKYDCYKILGFDYDSFGKSPPDTKEVTKKYRGLSRKWHPDKSNYKNAKERFVKIVRAYEVLTSKKKRKEYDFMRFNQEAYFQAYGSSVLWSYAPKSDVLGILLFLIILGNVFTWFAQKQRWQNVADRLVKAAEEEWSTSQGGSRESKQLREDALAILAEQEKKSEEAEGATASSSSAKKSKSKVKKVSGKEKKKLEKEAILPILKELVEEMHDFGAGYHKPTWRDLLIVSILRLPISLTMGIIWRTKYYLNRLRGFELNDGEQKVLTQNAVGPVNWDLATDEDREAMMKRKLWIMENLVEWKEEQELSNLSSKEQKQMRKQMKKEKGTKRE